MDTKQTVFFGTPVFAVPSLEALIKSGRNISLVVTQPDRPKGRGRSIAASAVKEFSQTQGLTVVQPRSLKDEKFQKALRTTNASVYVVVAYGRIFPKVFLDAAPLILNLHPSLLPRWRGAAPIERAIMAGDQKTGVSIMRLSEELDAGDVLAVEESPIGENETAGELRDRLAQVGARLLISTLDRLEHGVAPFEPQNAKAMTYAPPIRAEEARIQWQESAHDVHNLIRGLSPSPGGYTMDGNSRIKIFRSLLTKDPSNAAPGSIRIHEGRCYVACGDFWLELKELQREGRRRQSAEAFLLGYAKSQSVQWI